MSPMQLERVRAALAAAIQHPADERLAFVRSECADDEVVHAEVQSLLEIHSSAEDFLSRPLPELLGVGDGTAPPLPAGALLKSRSRIEQKVAQSDFATVYFAADELIGEKRV